MLSEEWMWVACGEMGGGWKGGETVVGIINGKKI